jgi:hypothetical protein
VGYDPKQPLNPELQKEQDKSKEKQQDGKKVATS